MASSLDALEIVTDVEHDRRQKWHRADRHRRKSLRGDEEPRRVRGAGNDDSVRGPSLGRATDARSRLDALARPAGAGSCRDGVLRILVFGQVGRPVRVYPRCSEERDRRSEFESVQRQFMVAGRTSPNSLYDEGIATMEGGGCYNQTDAEGFLRIQGLPGRVQARMSPRSY